MSATRIKVFQDIMHVLLMGVVTGVVFSMAVTGIVFLLSGPVRNADTDSPASKPVTQVVPEVR